MLYTRRSFQLPVTNRANPTLCAEKGIHTILRGECVHCGKTQEQLDSVEESQLHRAAVVIDAPAAPDAAAIDSIAYETKYVDLFGGPFDGTVLPAADLVPDGVTNLVTIDGVTARYEATPEVVRGLRHFLYAGNA